jgi:hypothetical protein
VSQSNQVAWFVDVGSNVKEGLGRQLKDIIFLTLGGVHSDRIVLCSQSKKETGYSDWGFCLLYAKAERPVSVAESVEFNSKIPSLCVSMNFLCGGRQSGVLLIQAISRYKI